MTEDELRKLVTEVVREVVKSAETKSPVVRDEDEPLRRGPHHRPLPAPKNADSARAATRRSRRRASSRAAPARGT